MTDQLIIALAQINQTVGDLPGNAGRILAARETLSGADLIIFPEMSVTGYPAEDLVWKGSFQRAVEETITGLAKATADGGPAMLVGGIRSEGDKLYNALFLLDDGAIKAIRDKRELPNYGVFDEKRVFDAGDLTGPVDFRGVKLGLMICEDLWFSEVAECLAETGADILITPHCSPFETGKLDQRLQVGIARVTETGKPVILVNQVGGQDEVVFDGTSYVLNADRGLAWQLPSFAEKIARTVWRNTDTGWVCDQGELAKEPDDLESIYRAMVLGLRDYVGKNRFPGVVIGLSGGIDSALSAAVAVDALGADAVHCLMMPSEFTSRDSLEDADECAGLLGVKLDNIPIKEIVASYKTALAGLFKGREEDSTEENIQARARGMIQMAVSNKFGFMVLTTGNKSEMSVGYATLYGDMCGGYSVLKDVYKTTVYKLSNWRNQTHVADFRGPEGRVIPERIITKVPTAELKADQADQDNLPPYDVLDDILRGFVEGEQSYEDIVARGHAPETVARVEHLLYVAEYKRRQAPPGVKITRKSFGRDRRYPMVNGFREARLSRKD